MKAVPRIGHCKNAQPAYASAYTSLVAPSKGSAISPQPKEAQQPSSGLRSLRHSRSISAPTKTEINANNTSMDVLDRPKKRGPGKASTLKRTSSRDSDGSTSTSEWYDAIEDELPTKRTRFGRGGLED